MKQKKTSRRDFLRSSITATACLPSLGTLLYNGRALASSNCSQAEVDTSMPAFLALDLQGGASIAGNNVMVYDRGGGLLTDYSGLGLTNALNPSSQSNMLNTDMGLTMHAHSPMLRGIKSIASSTVLANVNGCVICTQSADDTSSNKLATAPSIFLGGAQGLLVPLVGSMPSFPSGSGGNSEAASSAGVTPALITSIDSARRLMLPGTVWKNYPKSHLDRMLSLISKLSRTQMQKFSSLNLPDQVKEVVNCGYLRTQEILTQGERDASDSVDPRRDSAVSSLYEDDLESVIALTYLVLKRFAGSGTIALAGYDYHDGTALTGEELDIQAGRVIGMVLSMAAALQQKLMLHVYTDGGVDASSGLEEVNGVEKYVWVGDSETRSAAFVLIYNPDGRLSLQKQQLGAYKSADRGTIDLLSEHDKLSQNPVGQAAAVLANWLAWQGREGELESIMANSPIRPGELDKYLFMSKL